MVPHDFDKFTSINGTMEIINKELFNKVSFMAKASPRLRMNR